MTCPLENRLIAMLDLAGVEFTRPERDVSDPTNLDFYLTRFDLYVEVKQFHTPRISDQLAKVPQRSSVMVLVGPRAVEAFGDLVEVLAKRQGR